MPWGKFSLRTGAFLETHPGHQQIPRKWLDPMTWVYVPSIIPGTHTGNIEPQPNQPHPNLNGSAYARIDSGRFQGSTGYIPIQAFYTPPAPQPLPNAAAMYGMATQGGFVWEGHCPHCGEIPALHVLQSTQETQQAAIAISNQITQALQQAPPSLNNDPVVSLLKNGKQFMLGVLAVRGNNHLYVSHSGQRNSAFFDQVIQNFNHAQNNINNNNHAVQAIYAPAIRIGVDVILNRRNEPASNGSGTTYMQRFDYQCAAPRIIQCALRNHDYPTAMTEIYHGGQAHQQTILSCGRCRQTVPFMLCPL